MRKPWALGDNAFSRANKSATDLVRAFGIYHFEAFTIGIQSHLDKIDTSSGAAIEQLKAALRGIKLDSEFIKLTTGGGKNSPGPLGDRISFVEEKLAKFFQ